MAPATESLESFKVIDTADPDRFFSVARSFRPYLRGFSPTVTENGWRARFNLVSWGEVRIATQDTDGYQFSGFSGCAFFSTALRGDVELTSRNRSLTRPAGAVVPHIHDYASLRVGAGYQGIFLSRSQELLAGAIAAFLPENPELAMRGVEADLERYDFSIYRRNILNLHGLIGAKEPLLLDEGRYRREVNDLLLLSLAQALTGGQVEGPTPNAKRCFARAIDFIEAHFFEEIRITAIANAAGCSIRLLQDLFRALEGRTIVQHITARRLAHARSLLLKSAEGHSVTSAALDSGFSHFGLFARQYRAAFGELPSATRSAERAPRRGC
jgi:AraC-like DNA-binding protein